MIGIIGIITVLTALGLSMVITRMATVALTLMGLSREAARFQARSAFTGTGFTTSEAEKVTNHPVRRRIIMLLMIARSAGIITVIISLILSFAGSGSDDERLYRLIWLVAGVAMIWLLASSKYLNEGLERLISWALRRFTSLDVRDYASLLQLTGNYAITELAVKQDDWLADKQLAQCSLPEEGATVLGILRDDGTRVGAPKSSTKVYAGDTLILYGSEESLRTLDQRSADAEGDEEHRRAVEAHQNREAEQERKESQYRQKRRQVHSPNR